MKRYLRYLLLLPILGYLPVARAQSAIDIAIGGGTAWDKTNGNGIDNASALNPFNSCLINTGDIYCQETGGIGGFFLGFGANVMLADHYGFGGEVNFQPSQRQYGPLQFRESFYDFNGIYAPLSTKRAILELQGGIGGASTSFSFNQSQCVGTAVCSNQNESVGNANHFQVHAGLGLQLFLTQHIFLRPQFDIHYVPNLGQQFDRDLVPEATLWLGYRIGGK